MDDLNSLVSALDKNQDLTDKLLSLLDRQTDHKLSPHLLLGFLGMFNILSIMSVVHGRGAVSLRDIKPAEDSRGQGVSSHSLTDALSGLLTGQGGAQPDLLGLLGSLAGKKNINPGLLLSLMSMLNASGSSGSSGSSQPAVPAPSSVDAGTETKTVESGRDSAQDKTPEKKSPDAGVELKYDKRKGLQGRT